MDKPIFPRKMPRLRLLAWKLGWWWERNREKLPWIENEGEATARVVDLAFDMGYPQVEDYDSIEDAVQHLQDIWNIIDNWDGSRLNVKWARDGIPKGWLHVAHDEKEVGEP